MATDGAATPAQDLSAAGGEIESLVEATRLAAAEAQRTQAAVVAIAHQAVETHAQIAKEQAAVAVKSSHIESAKEHADKVRGDLDSALTSSKAQATEIENLAARAKLASDNSVQILAEVAALKESALQEVGAATRAKEAAETATGATKKLAEKADGVEATLTAYEARLAALEQQCNAQLAEITRLLPGATSAGLAYAFDQRRQSFTVPAKRWQQLFVGSIACLVILALTGMWAAYKTNGAAEYDELLRLWLARLPIAAALLWLAIHAGRESALAKRLEEDYGYKAAVAASFQGFHAQMLEIGGAAASNAALTKLCEDTLATIASPPGRIYDKHQLTVTPSGELSSSAKGLLSDLIKRFGPKVGP